MKQYIKLAWRNIWRNKRRTLITAASIFFAMFFALIMRSFQLGTYDHMVHNVVEAFTGYIQIHNKGYWEKKDINNTLKDSAELREKIRQVENVELLVPRLQSFALGSSGPKTKGVGVTGISPEVENELTGLKNKLVKGQYLEPGDGGIMLGERLANYLQLDVNDTIVFLGQGYHGVTAAGKYPVKGILHFPSPDLDKRMTFLSLEQAQALFGAENRLTSYVINLKDPDDFLETAQDIESVLNGDNYEVMHWKEMLPELVQQIQSDNASGLIFIGVLYVVIAFGIFGTVLMMTVERRREFGVMIAVGMRKTKLTGVVIFEMFFIGIIGIIAGIIGSIPVIQWFYHNPIKLTGEYATMMEQFGLDPVMPFAWDIGFFANQTLAVAIIMIIAVIYPIYSISKIKVNKALRA